MSTQNPPVRPLLRIVRGAPTDVELAAVVAVITARTAACAPQQPTVARSRWAVPRPRAVPWQGPGGWQTSARSS